MINQLLHNILIGSLVSSMLVIFLISFRKIIIKNIGAIWNYYAWFTIFVPWVAIWLPWNFLSSTNLKVSTFIQPLSRTLLDTPHQFTIFLPTIFIFIWLSGVIICLIHILFNHLTFVSKLEKNSRSMKIKEQDIITRLLTNNQKKYLSRIHISEVIESPMICHFLKEKIYLPTNFFDKYSSTEQKYVMQHEFVHIKRYDLTMNVVMCILCCFNWFNPIMFYAYRHFRNAQELSCDALVSQTLPSYEKKEYGYALLKTVINQSTKFPVMSCGWNTQKQLKERCQMLKFHHLKPIKTFLGIGLLTAIICTAIAAPKLGEHKMQFITSKITFAANIIQPADEKGNMLIGNVQLSVENKVNITANKVLVKYADKSKHAVAEFTIYGEGVLTEGEHSMRFINGTFNPNTYQLYAEKIDRIS